MSCTGHSISIKRLYHKMLLSPLDAAQKGKVQVTVNITIDSMSRWLEGSHWLLNTQFCFVYHYLPLYMTFTSICPIIFTCLNTFLNTSVFNKWITFSIISVYCPIATIIALSGQKIRIKTTKLTQFSERISTVIEKKSLLTRPTGTSRFQGSILISPLKNK